MIFNVNTYKKYPMKNINGIIIGLVVVIGTFLIMNYWPRIKETTKNKIIASIFGIIAIAFVILIALLLF